MAGNSDLPPAYSSLQLPPATLNIDTVEEGEPKSDDVAELLVDHPFEDKTTRLIFIQKVLAIKLLQLLGVVVVMASSTVTVAYTYHRWFIYRNAVHFIAISVIAYLVVFILLVCCDQARRQKPYKYIFLVAYPLSLAFFISSVTCALTEVVMAWAYHCVAVLALLVYNIFVMQTKFDFDTLHGFYICTAVQMFFYTLSVPFLPFYVDPFYVLYPTIVLALEHLYLLFALEVMTSKTYKTALTPDDFPDAAINLHIDYIYIFVKLLVPKIRSVWRKCTVGME